MFYMQIRTAVPEDLPQILSLYENARSFMAACGNATQWKDGYPSKELLESDIRQRRLYLLADKERIAAVFMFFIGEEPTYRSIEGGQWLNSRPYGTIHRLASAGTVSRAADPVILWCREQCRSCSADLRGDTHEKNLPMQKVFARNGFCRCGIIHVQDGTPRIAYQLDCGK